MGLACMYIHKCAHTNKKKLKHLKNITLGDVGNKGVAYIYIYITYIIVYIREYVWYLKYSKGASEVLFEICRRHMFPR